MRKHSLKLHREAKRHATHASQERLARTRAGVRDAWGEMRTSPLTSVPLDDALDETTAADQMRLMRRRIADSHMEYDGEFEEEHQDARGDQERCVQQTDRYVQQADRYIQQADRYIQEADRYVQQGANDRYARADDEGEEEWDEEFSSSSSAEAGQSYDQDEDGGEGEVSPSPASPVSVRQWKPQSPRQLQAK